MRHVRTKFFTICYSCNISWSKTANGKHACVPSSRCFVKRKSFVSIKKQAYRSSQHTEQNIGFKTEHILWYNKSECLALQPFETLTHPNIHTFFSVNSGWAFHVSFLLALLCMYVCVFNAVVTQLWRLYFSFTQYSVVKEKCQYYQKCTGKHVLTKYGA